MARWSDNLLEEEKACCDEIGIDFDERVDAMLKGFVRDALNLRTQNMLNKMAQLPADIRQQVILDTTTRIETEAAAVETAKMEKPSGI